MDKEVRNMDKEVRNMDKEGRNIDKEGRNMDKEGGVNVGRLERVKVAHFLVRSAVVAGEQATRLSAFHVSVGERYSHQSLWGEVLQSIVGEKFNP